MDFTKANLVISNVASFIAYIYLFFITQYREGVSAKDALSAVLRRSAYGQLLELAQALGSVVSCVIFVAETYWVGEEGGTPESLFQIEVSLSIFFFYHYILYLVLSESYWRYLCFDFQGLVDLITIIPVFLMIAAGRDAFIGLGFLRFARIIKFARVLRLLRIFKSVDVLSDMAAGMVVDNAIFRQSMVLISTIVSFLVCCTGLVQWLAQNKEDEWAVDDNMKFHDAFYFIVCTFSSVGYGDIAPKEPLGRMVVVSMIAVAMLVVPLESQKLFDLLALQPKYGGHYRRNKRQSHIVVISDSNCSGVYSFLQEFFHEDHGKCDAHVVVLCPVNEPATQLKALLLQKGGKGGQSRLTFLSGDAILQVDLYRARVDLADACFILVNKFAEDPDNEDARAVLRAMSVRHFNRNVRVFVQIIEPENRVHLLEAGIPPDDILCVDQLKLNVLGTNCMCHGYTVLIANLCSSSALSLESMFEYEWQMEYALGMVQEIYSMQVLKHLVDLDIFEAAAAIYSFSTAATIGIGRYDENNCTHQVVLNPGSYKLKSRDVLYVICESPTIIKELLIWEELLQQSTAYQSSCRESGTLRTSERSSGLDDRLKQEVWMARRSFSNLAVRSCTNVVSYLNSKIYQPPFRSFASLHGDSHLAAAPKSLHENSRQLRSDAEKRAKGSRKGFQNTARNNLDWVINNNKELMRSLNKSSMYDMMADFFNGRPAPSTPENDRPPSTAASSAWIHELKLHGSRPSIPVSRNRSASGNMQRCNTMSAEFALEAMEVLNLEHANLCSSPISPGLFPTSGAATPTSEGSQIRERAQTLDTEKTLEDFIKLIKQEQYLPLLLAHKIDAQSLLLLSDDDLREAEIPLGPRKLIMQGLLDFRNAKPAGVTDADLNEQHLKYYLKQRRAEGELEVELNDAIIVGQTMLVDHIVIIVDNVDDLFFLISNIRASESIGQIAPIIVFTKTKPSRREWRELNFLGSIYIMLGNMLDMKSFCRTNFTYSKLCVLLTPSGGEDMMDVDSQLILTALGIHSEIALSGSHTWLVTELFHDSMARHLRPLNMELAYVSMAHLLEPAFAAGQAVSSSWLETLMAQAYFNPHTLKVVQLMVTLKPNWLVDGESGVLSHPEPDKEHLATMREASRPISMKVNPKWDGKEYIEMYTHLTRQKKLLPLGLYRHKMFTDNPYPYMLTNPPPKTIVSKLDSVIVFQAPMAPGESFGVEEQDIKFDDGG
ncbi:hypothetical protein CYMTET_40608 [Cymbomonas tetramitiformis]|uniref:RCK N-terminal domain-containing protein n=1 Tax=Cymbomonas tetramitiformis TaxID=36881 RepID=A0AAE0C9I6_9CHLO|nr:hypothetical protein CYMTET_40608 [Cymbomonas tetramitiformis]